MALNTEFVEAHRSGNLSGKAVFGILTQKSRLLVSLFPSRFSSSIHSTDPTTRIPFLAYHSLRKLTTMASVEERHPELFRPDLRIDRQSGIRTVPMVSGEIVYDRNQDTKLILVAIFDTFYLQSYQHIEIESQSLTQNSDSRSRSRCYFNIWITVFSEIYFLPKLNWSVVMCHCSCNSARQNLVYASLRCKDTVLSREEP